MLKRMIPFLIIVLFLPIVVNAINSVDEQSCLEVLKYMSKKELSSKGINVEIPFNYPFFVEKSNSTLSYQNFYNRRSDKPIYKYQYYTFGRQTAFTFRGDNLITKLPLLKEYTVIFYSNDVNKTFEACALIVLFPLEGYSLENISRSYMGNKQYAKVDDYFRKYISIEKDDDEYDFSVSENDSSESEFSVIYFDQPIRDINDVDFMKIKMLMAVDSKNPDTLRQSGFLADQLQEFKNSPHPIYPDNYYYTIFVVSVFLAIVFFISVEFYQRKRKNSSMAN